MSKPTPIWKKYDKNPVLGGEFGTCFDLCVLKDKGKYRMYFSWRPKKAIAFSESSDGLSWSDPVIVLSPNEDSGWETEVDRPVVVFERGLYHMWYTGQVLGDTPNSKSWIGFASSLDGITWNRRPHPVLTPSFGWEKKDVMCPHVIWDMGMFRMWYSGGEQYEPDSIGYAESADGIHWDKPFPEPVFRADPRFSWEAYKVTGSQVIRRGDHYLMFYIGFKDLHTASIGVARSPNGIDGWIRLPANPILRPTPGQWDADACYKPWAIEEENRWILWYNGRNGAPEQIGVATMEGHDLGY